MKWVLWVFVWFPVVLFASVPWYVDVMNLENPEWGFSSSGEVVPVSVSNGHFYSGGKRLRFFGFNITGDKNFPLKGDAPRIARALRLFGINIVRLHFMEHSWGEGSLLLSPEKEELDTNALDRLDYFVFCLKREGIYVNMNLHVGRVFPQIPFQDREVFELGKIVGYIDDQLVESQKRYATALLAHTNPYTGMPYTKDPVVAVIEVNNENALTGIDFQELSRLSSYYQDILRVKWTDFLRKKYGSFVQWQAENHIKTEKPLLISQTNRRQRFYWRWEAHEGAVSRCDWQGDTLVWKVEKPGKEEWHNQFMCAGFPVVGGGVYEVVFEAKSEASFPVFVYLMQDESPWEGLGFFTNIRISSGWQRYRFRFMPAFDESKTRLNFSTEMGKTGKVEIRNFVLRQITETGAEEGLWQKNSMPLPWEGLIGKQVIADFRTFLLQREQEVVRVIRDHIRGLGCTKPITHTQVTYGGLAGLLREGHLSDFVDIHAYWQHPEFPGKAWSPTDWRIDNTSQLTDAALGPLSYVAYWRVVGKPFTVSEYNVPDPNEYGFEAPLWLALWGAFQDWDGVYLYTLLDFGGNYYQKHMTGFFHFIGSGGKMSLLPWAVRVFRKGIPWSSEVIRGVNPSEMEKAYTQGGPWYDVKRFAFWTNESLFAKVKVDFSGRNQMVLSQTMPWRWEKTPSLLLWQSEEAFLLTGNVRGISFTNGNMIVEVAKDASWGAIALCTLDEKSWRETKKILGVMVGKGENTAMKWNATRTSVGNKWGRPPYLLFQPAWRLFLPGFRAYLLDERGRKREEILSSEGWFTFGVETTPWILFEKKP